MLPRNSVLFCTHSIPNCKEKDVKKGPNYDFCLFLTYLTMNLLVFEVLGGPAGDAFSECIPDLFPEGILGVIFGRLSEFGGDWGSHVGSALA